MACHVLECGTEVALPMPADWSSDDDDGAAVAPHPGGSAEDPTAAALQRLGEVPAHNTTARRLADPQSAGASALAATASREAHAAQRCDRVEYRDAGCASFAARYLEGTGRPCIIRGAPEAEGWRARERWADVETFVEHYGAVPVQVTEMASSLGGKPMRVELPIREFIAYARRNDSDWPYYSWERNWSGARADILADFRSPQPFADDLYDLSEETREFLPLSCHLFVLIGGARSGSNMHKDPKWTSAWNTVLCGRKRWVLFPPHVPAEAIGAAAGSDYRAAGPPAYWWIDHYPRLAEQGAELGMVDVVQGPGDTIWIPSGWWHAVLNLPGEGGATVCCTRNCLSPQSLPRVWPQMCESCPDFARRFAREIRARRPDAAHWLPAAAAEQEQERPRVVGDPSGWCVERRHCSELSLRECRERYIRDGRPLIVTGLADRLCGAECRSLSREWLRSRLGMKMVAVRSNADLAGCSGSGELVSMDEFCRRLDARQEVYLYDCSLPLQLPALLQHIRVPRYFAHCRLQRTRRRHCFDRSWPTLFIGARGTHSRLHVDQWHGHFWMSMLSGTKRWTIWHPEDAAMLCAPGSTSLLDFEAVEASESGRRARRVDFALHEGEVLFVPGGSPHYVVNATDSCAVAGNFVDESNYDAAVGDMRAMALAPGGDAVAGAVEALEEVDWDSSEDPAHTELLPPEHLVVPYEHFRGGSAACWPAVPPHAD